MPAPEDIFPKEFVPNIEGASYHPKWVAANKSGDAPKWAAFRDAVLTYKAGDTLAVRREPSRTWLPSSAQGRNT